MSSPWPRLTFHGLIDLLGVALPDSDPDLQSSTGPLSALVAGAPVERSDFKDTRYRNIRSIGLSLQFAPKQGDHDWRLSCIDVYNEQKGPKGWSAFRDLPLVLDVLLPSSDAEVTPKPCRLEVQPSTTGQEFVHALGEPTRKGGGEAAAGGVSASGWGPGAYCEWNVEAQVAEGGNRKITILVELAGPAARGHERWEAEGGGKAVWSYIMLALTE